MTRSMRALVLVDVVKDFEHEDGDRLLASFQARHAGLCRILDEARTEGMPVVYANDDGGAWDSNAPALVRRAVEGPGGALVSAVAPRQGEHILLKKRYSAFDGTSLALLLEELRVGEVVLAGTATEMCVFQTAIDALRSGFDVTVKADACATVNEEHEELALDYLEQVLAVRVMGRSSPRPKP
jgi:nicotinamidase-related amidase